LKFKFLGILKLMFPKWFHGFNAGISGPLSNFNAQYRIWKNIIFTNTQNKKTITTV